MADISGFETGLFSALRRLQQAGEGRAKRLRRFGGVTPIQLLILRVLANESRLTASALSRGVSLSAASLSGLLERMEEAGLPEWEQHSLTAALLRTAELCGELE